MKIRTKEKKERGQVKGHSTVVKVKLNVKLRKINAKNSEWGSVNVEQEV